MKIYKVAANSADGFSLFTGTERVPVFIGREFIALSVNDGFFQLCYEGAGDVWTELVDRIYCDILYEIADKPTDENNNSSASGSLRDLIGQDIKHIEMK